VRVRPGVRTPRRPHGIPGYGRAAAIAPALLVALAFVGPPRPTLSPPGPTIPGLDVSHYQGTIDWPAVAAKGYRFVYVKATEGRTRVDPTFARNAGGAREAGLMVGAYHFARPDDSPGDAVAEADEFLRTARPGGGDLVPVLDLEAAGSLDPPALRAWVRTWLTRVRAATGVRPLIYVGSTFWRVRMDDPTAFVSYPLMWAATQAGSTLPAHGWSTFGWTAWQWSSCGSVPGIEACVDLDVLRTDRLSLVRIP
jgi:lysozyme